jgi:hypothetical protein
MAEPCSAPTLREPAERTGAVPEEAEQGLGTAKVPRVGLPEARPSDLSAPFRSGAGTETGF